MYRINDRSAAVREVQGYLRELSRFYSEIPNLHIDGIYGDETREAVRALQRMQGLAQTGEIDYETFLILYELYLPIKEERIGNSELIPAEAFPLRMGDSGSYVRILQSVLSEIFSLSLPTDGFYGGTTENAVRRAEERYGKTPTGSVDRILWQKIAADYRASVLEKIPR